VDVLRTLEWRAILAGVAAVIVVNILIPLLFIAAVPLLREVPELAPPLVWISDSTAGRTLTSLMSIAVGWLVSYRVAEQRKVLHGFLAPILLLIGLSSIGLVIALVGSGGV